MAIGYDNMTAEDAANYFNGCTVFHWQRAAGSVTPYTLRMEPLEYDEDGNVINDYEMAHDSSFMLCKPGDFDRYVTGDRLWVGDEYITHRFGLGYVPMCDNSRLLRISCEPDTSRMIKGLSPSFVHYHDVVSGIRTGRDIEDIAEARYRNWEDIVNGIAQVLEIGTPPVMRQRIPAEQAWERARTAVRRMFQCDDMVCVPEFSVAVVRHALYPSWAHVLRNGRMVGYLFWNDELVKFIPIKAVGTDREVARSIDQGLQTMVMRLLTPNVERPIGPHYNPIGGSKYV